MLCGLFWEINLVFEPLMLDDAHDQSGFVEHVIKTGEVIYSAA